MSILLRLRFAADIVDGVVVDVDVGAAERARHLDGVNNAGRPEPR